MARRWTEAQRREAGERLRAAKLAKENNTPIINGTKPLPQQPRPLSPASVEAGIQQPTQDDRPKGILIRQISEDEAIAQLDEMDVQEWVLYHYNKGDFNIQGMANVLRESTEEIYNRLHAQGIELPEGTYSVNR